MPNAVRRVGGTSEAEQTYTLGPNEAFRLDAVSFTIDWASEGTYVIPRLVAKDSGGFTLAEIDAVALGIAPPVLTPFTFTGPANLTDDVSVLPPDGYGGYLFHDFGAGVTTSQITLNWTQPPGEQAWVAELWLGSAGAASMGPVIGTSTVENTDTVTVQLTAGISAGHDLLLHVTLLSAQNWINPTDKYRPVITDSRGGNVLEPAYPEPGAYAQTSLQRPDGLYLSSFVCFYRISNPLSAGDTVTLRNVLGPALWMSMNANDVTGLKSPEPRGPNAGGNYVQLGQAPGVSPFTSTPNPVPKWVGPVLINDAYLIPDGGIVNAMFARGGVEIIPPPGAGFAGAVSYDQAPLPELHLGPFDTLTASSQDTANERTGDLIKAFLVWGVDE
jgi:hypothetical protein